MADHPIIPSNFKKFIGTPIQGFILPIIPVGSKLSPNSNISTEMLGKIPGRYNAQEGHWAGWNWQSNRATEFQLERWHEWQNVVGPIALGVILGEIIVVDGDCDNEAYALLVRRLAEKHLGFTLVVRRREGAVRFQLFYRLKPHTPPITKQRCFYKDANDVKYLTEVLGRGQQTVAEGPHAKGSMHYWEGEEQGIDLITGYDFLPEVTIEQVDAFLRELGEESEKLGLERVRLSPPTTSDLAAAVSLDDLTSPHIAENKDLLARAIKAIDINSPLLADYDRWLSLLRAMWAGCAGNRQFYVDHILPWLMGNPANKEEDMEAKLISFTDSQVGAAEVYNWAAQFGFNEGKQALTADIFANAPIQLPADAGGDGTSNGNGAGAGGPGGPIPPNDTHRALTLAFEAASAETRRYNVDTKQWLEHEGAVWRICHTVLSDIGNMAAVLSAQLLNNPTVSQGAARARALESTGTHLSVRTMLQSRPAIIIHEEDFDADPFLLNTPGFVIDLRSGETMEHNPSLLMRQQTLVTPDVLAYQNYPNACAQFMAFLEIIADGRDWVIPFLQRWFGYCLTGSVRHQHFLFLQGLPGTGKTQLITILNVLMHTYATTLRSIWMMKNTEKRFDMVKIIGKRMGFSDETQKGSTFDEERLSNVASALGLQAELKGGREFDFPNLIKLILCGNHRPHFISGEAGGLTRRLLMFEVTNQPISEAGKVEEGFAQRLVAEEGPAILMWAVEGAMLDWADTDNLIFNTLKRPMVEAAYRYTRENSLYWQWFEARMRLGPQDEVDIDMIDAFDSFKDYVWATTHERCRERRVDFKGALIAMLGDKISFPETARTKGPHKNRTYIKGLSVAMPFDAGAAGNVVSLDSVRKPSTETSGGAG